MILELRLHREHSQLNGAVAFGQLNATGKTATYLGEYYQTARCCKDLLDDLSIRSPDTNEMSFGRPASEIFTPVGRIDQ